jgi:hypothetical protein
MRKFLVLVLDFPLSITRTIPFRLVPRHDAIAGPAKNASVPCEPCQKNELFNQLSF